MLLCKRYSGVSTVGSWVSGLGSSFCSECSVYFSLSWSFAVSTRESCFCCCWRGVGISGCWGLAGGVLWRLVEWSLRIFRLRNCHLILRLLPLLSVFIREKLALRVQVSGQGFLSQIWLLILVLVSRLICLIEGGLVALRANFWEAYWDSITIMAVLASTKLNSVVVELWPRVWRSYLWVHLSSCPLRRRRILGRTYEAPFLSTRNRF